MHHPIIAVYDANVLYPAPLRDLFIRLAQTGLVRAKWTEAIHDEWVRSVLENNPTLSPDRLARTRSLMNEAIRDCLVTDYEALIDSLIPMTGMSWLPQFTPALKRSLPSIGETFPRKRCRNMTSRRSIRMTS